MILTTHDVVTNASGKFAEVLGLRVESFGEKGKKSEDEKKARSEEEINKQSIN